MPRTGVWKETHSAPLPAWLLPSLVAKLTPRSENDRWGGPAVLTNAKPPVRTTSARFVTGVVSDHGP